LIKVENKAKPVKGLVRVRLFLRGEKGMVMRYAWSFLYAFLLLTNLSIGSSPPNRFFWVPLR
jgi:hypothetical protein